MQAPSFTRTRAAVPSVSPFARSGRQKECLSDQELITLHKSGDLGAADVLIRRYDNSIHGLAYQLAGNYDDAQEIAGQALLRIYQNLHTLQHAITLRAWINRIVVNVHINMIRCSRRRPAISMDELQEKWDDVVWSMSGQSSPSPEVLAEQGERAEILSEAIAALPEFQRRLVELFHHDGRSYDEISSSMRIPIGTVKSRLNRARLALREMLTPDVAILMN